MATTTFTAPLAYIMINNQKIGKIRNINFNENLQRGEVVGLGEVALQEAPVTGIRCQFNASTYMIDLKKFGSIKDPFFPIDATDLTTLINTILLGEEPVSIHIYRRTAGNIDANGIVTSEGQMERMGIVQDCYLTSRSWNITEGSLAGKDLTGLYFNPVYLT